MSTYFDALRGMNPSARLLAAINKAEGDEVNPCGCKRTRNERGQWELMLLSRCAQWPRCGVPYLGDRP